VSVIEDQRPSISVVIPAYNPGPGLDACLASLCAQDVRAGAEVIVVDDGSTHPVEIDPGLQRLRLLRLPRNLGRAAARNAGAHAACGDLLAFLDSDCVPDSSQWLQAHVDALTAGAIATTGPLTGGPSPFWDRYQRDVSSRRRSQHAAGDEYAGTTANLAVTRAAFMQIGGFDEAYSGYGFEDRDLLLRLMALGRIAWIDAAVLHLDVLRLAAIRDKFIEAGGAPAQRFHLHHPDAYAALGYARCDTRLHPVLRLLAVLAAPLSAALAHTGDWLIEHGAMPFALGRPWVKATTALAFMAGTRRNARA
jgi:glycosyltransferase involved in cell wall biosynthesis